MVTFVILNYNNYKDTIVCVDSILKLNQEIKYNIVIVDNYSTNDSFNKLKEKYTDTNEVECITTDKNLGFANGNNFGCSFAIKKYHPDFLYTLNNDTEIKDKDILKKLLIKYDEEKFDIYGPQIFDIHENEYSNPIHVPNNLKEIKLHKIRLTISRFMLHFGVFMLRATYFILTKILRKCNYSDYGLCGAVLVFSKQYYEKFNNVFVDKTFMYGEEYFLDYRKKKYNLKVVFDDTVIINHLGGASTNKLNTNLYKFKMDCKIDSVNQLINAYENDLDV